MAVPRLHGGYYGGYTQLTVRLLLRSPRVSDAAVTHGRFHYTAVTRARRTAVRCCRYKPLTHLAAVTAGGDTGGGPARLRARDVGDGASRR